MNEVTHSSFLFKAPVDLLSLLLQLVAQLLLGPLLLFLQEAQLSQLLPPEETTPTVQSGCHRINSSQIQWFTIDDTGFYSQKTFIFHF